ncbi:unnamed protein product [Effrenium voratum]|uniref:Methyltransferase type 11 domain-containing protein n=1 Tax=Effrenium voratum TaxID=2562239 RepID=A0AA36JDA3_9DINO|nr:unnamed protein product [Effrenium voratum]
MPVPWLAVRVLWLRHFLLLSVASSTVQVSQGSFWDSLYAENTRLGVEDFNASWQEVDLAKLSQVLEGRIDLRSEELRVAVLGSGDSPLPQEMVAQGIRAVTAIDSSEALSRMPRPGLRWLKEDARKPTSLEASAFDLVVELGLLDVILAEPGDAAGLLREARRLLCAGGLFVSGSTDAPSFRLPLLAKHPAGGWAEEAEVLRLPRARKLDPRLVELDPAWEVDNIFIYVSRAAGEVEVGQAQKSKAAPKDSASPVPNAQQPEPAPPTRATPAQQTPVPPEEPPAPPPEAPAPPQEAPAPPQEAPSPPQEAPAPAPPEAPAPPQEAPAPPPEAPAPPQEAPAPPQEAPAPLQEAPAPPPEAPAPPQETPAPPPKPPAPPPEAPAPPQEAPAPPPEAPAPPQEEPAPPPEAPAPPEDVSDFAASIRRLQAQAAALAKSAGE